MEVSILLMQQIAQLFIVLLMGYVVVKAGLLKASDSKVLSVVFVYLVMPCVVLNAFQIDDTPQIRTGLLPLTKKAAHPKTLEYLYSFPNQVFPDKSLPRS